MIYKKWNINELDSYIVLNMKRIFLSLLIAFYAAATWACRAWHEPVLIQQSDGTTLSILVHGDQHFSWRTTIDGVIIVEKNSNYYVGIIDTEGNLTASPQLAHDKAQRSAAEQQLANSQNRELYFTKQYQALQAPLTRNMPIVPDAYTFPHMGSPKVLVILAQYSDVKFTLPNPRKSFNQYLNSMEDTHQNFGNDEHRNFGSVKKYFSDMSYQQFTPQFDLYGPITLPQSMEYYGKGANESGTQASNIVIDACKLMDDSLDFSQYDSNKDGIVDLVYIIYAGYGENMGASTNTLWPKAFSISNHVTAEGKRIGRCGISNELIGNEAAPATKRINGIGLFCHEFSHCLGLPDFYPTNKNNKTMFPTKDAFDDQGMEAWSVMDYGCYVQNGYVPVAYTAWEREAMGWLKVNTLSTSQDVELKSIDEEGGKAYRIMNDDDPSANDYYMLQHIQAHGWNKGIQTNGLLMYHINYNASEFSLSKNAPNNIKGKPRMTVVPADGKLLASYKIGANVQAEEITPTTFYESIKADVFPGVNNVTEIKDSMNLVNYVPWVGDSLLRKPITNIENVVYTNAAGANSSYTKFSIKMLDKDQPTTGITSISDNQEIATNDQRIYRLDGSFAGETLNNLPKGVYIRNKKKFIVP